VKYIILFCILASYAFGSAEKATDEDVILTGDIILTAQNIASTKTKTPKWVYDFHKEADKYHYLSKQPSLATLRSTGNGNCVAFAKLGAWYAIRAGYNCKFIAILHGEDGHMFLYATQKGENWVVSNDTHRQVDSIKDAIFRMNAFGSLIIRETNVTIGNLDSHGSEIIQVNGMFLRNPEPEGRTVIEYPSPLIDIDSPKDEYNINP
jgi:hypothetical protein